MEAAIAGRPHHRAVVDAVRMAGCQLLALQPQVCIARKAAVKADGTIVTAADFASQETLLAAIDQHAPPPYMVVCEEEAQSLANAACPTTWFIDPLDGTSSYVAGSTDFAILVSEWSVDRPTFSVVYYPALGELAVAVGERVKSVQPPANAARDTSQALAVIQTCYLSAPALQQVIHDFGPATLCEDGAESTRALLNVATGGAAAALVLLCGHKSWDLAPLLHLVAASGGRVSDERGEPLRFSGPEVSGRYLVAANDVALHSALLSTTQRLVESEL